MIVVWSGAKIDSSFTSTGVRVDIKEYFTTRDTTQHNTRHTLVFGGDPPRWLTFKRFLVQGPFIQIGYIEKEVAQDRVLLNLEIGDSLLISLDLVDEIVYHPQLIKVDQLFVVVQVVIVPIISKRDIS